MNYSKFIKDYLEFFPKCYWEKCIHHLMYDIEKWDKTKCKKFANELRRERLKRVGTEM